MKITKKQKFDAAHALYGYNGPCANIHGHTWWCEIEMEVEELDRCGISVDFKVLKETLNEVLPDHKLLLSDRWPEELLHLLQKQFPGHVVILAQEPTAENLSCMLHADILQALSRRLLEEGNPNAELVQSTLKVRVWESDTAYCECNNFKE